MREHEVLFVSSKTEGKTDITNYEIKSPQIPVEFDGFKIAHLSDAHSEAVPGVMNILMKERPDIIVCTGDMADDEGHMRHAVRFAQRLCEISEVFFVSGNHDLLRTDFPSLFKKLSDMGIKYLRDERIILEKGEGKIAISGMDDPNMLSKGKIIEEIDKSKAKLGKFDGFEILLFHRANCFEYLAGGGFDIVLSGHMHGGQVRLPGLGGAVSPKTSILSDSKLFRPKYFAGAYTYEDMTMIVSRGLGNPMLLPRIFNKPEIGIIKLRNEKNE